jgi:hypothetical protein
MMSLPGGLHELTTIVLRWHMRKQEESLLLLSTMLVANTSVLRCFLNVCGDVKCPRQITLSEST